MDQPTDPKAIVAILKARRRKARDKRYPGLNSNKPKKVKEKKPRVFSAEEREAARQRMLARNPNPKGEPMAPERRAKIKESCNASEKHKSNTAKMLADPKRVEKGIKTKLDRGLPIFRKPKPKTREKKKPVRGTVGNLIAVDGRGSPRYTAYWVSPVDAKYQLKIATILVIKYGRPRDPWGNFMRPKHPEHIFGIPVVDVDPVIIPPDEVLPPKKPDVPAASENPDRIHRSYGKGYR